MAEDRKASIINRMRERGFEPLRRKPLDPKTENHKKPRTLILGLISPNLPQLLAITVLRLAESSLSIRVFFGLFLSQF